MPELVERQPYTQLMERLEIFHRRKWMLIVPLIICTGIAAGLAFTLPPSYRSTTLILVERQKIPKQYVTPTDATSVVQRLSTIEQQILSRTKLEQIIKEFNLLKEKRKEPVNAYLKKLSKLPGMWRLGFGGKPSMEEKVKQMRLDISVEVIGARKQGGDAFTVSFTGKTAQTTMEITNAIASLFIEENLRLREQFVEGTSEFLDDEMKKAKKELEDLEKSFRDFKEENMGTLPEQLDANLRTLDRQQLELQSVRASIIDAENRKALFEKQLTLNPGSLTTAPIPLQTELKNLNTQLSYLLSAYTEKYPDVVSVRKRIRVIEELLANPGRGENYITTGSSESKPGLPGESELKGGAQNLTIYSELDPINFEIKQLRRREAKIKKQIKVYEKRVEEIPANEQKLSAIQRNYEMSQSNYQSLLAKKLSARLAENLEKKQKGERFRIIDPANLPEKPFKPNKLRFILFGAMAGIGFGAGLVYMIELLNPAFRKQEDIENVLPQPVLGVIPLFPKSTGKKQKMTSKVIKENKKKVV